MFNSKIQKAPVAQPIIIPPGEDTDGSNCPTPKRANDAKNETKATNYAGTMTGRVGLTLEEQTRVHVTDVQLDATQTINFGDVRVVQALAGQGNCEATRSSTTLLEIPFEIVKNGQVRVNLDAFTEIVARAQGITLDQNTFGTTAPNGGLSQQPTTPVLARA